MAIKDNVGTRPAQARSATDQVLQEIRAAILAGPMKPREQLPVPRPSFVEAALGR